MIAKDWLTKEDLHSWWPYNSFHNKENWNTEATLLVSPKSRMARLQFANKYLKKQPQFWKKVLWTDEAKMSDGKSKVWRREGYPRSKAYHLICETSLWLLKALAHLSSLMI